MKALFSLATLVCIASFASAQTLQIPVFYPPTDHVVKSEITPQGKSEIIERQTIILLGFAPRPHNGELTVQTRALSFESRNYDLEAHINSRKFDSVFVSLESELVKGEFPNFKPRMWQWSTPAKISGWGVVPTNTLRATERCGYLMYCVYTQRLQTEGTSDSKNLFLNPMGNSRRLHFRGSMSNQVDGPMLRPMEKGRPIDFQTLPTREQMEEVDSHRYGG